MSKKPRPRYAKLPPEPPLLQTLRDLGYTGDGQLNVDVSEPNALENYRAKMWDDLGSRSVGDLDDILAIWKHTIKAKDTARLAQIAIVQRAGSMAKRQNFASVAIQGAAQTLDVALLFHTARDTWFAAATISQCRIALELAAKAVFISTGADDEPGRWRSAHMIRDRHKRRAAQISMSEAMPVLQRYLAIRHPNADAIEDVYHWLCGYVHFDARALIRNQNHEDAYAALAYVGWATAVGSEVVTGVMPIAEWPKRWPARKPW
jgi:hypothetical protein